MIRFDGNIPFKIPCVLNGDGTLTTTEVILVAMPNGMEEFVIPKGTTSDGQSRPWFAPFAGRRIGSKYDIAWLFHDVMCSRANKTEAWFDRFSADALLGYVLFKCGASRAKIWMTVLACMTYGRFSFFTKSGW